MAANAGAIRAGRAFVELFTDDSKLVRGLRAASGKLKAWGSTVTGMGVKLMAGGAAIVGPMLAAVKTFMSAGDALDKMSGRVGVSVEFLSALGHAADLGGSNLEAMEVGIRRMQRSAYDASQGTKSTADAFATLGVSVRGTDGKLKGTEQLFMESATALSKLENNTTKAAIATILFGRAGTQLLPMLKDGKAGLLGVMEEAKKLGLVMSTEDATAAAELTDAWTRLTSGAKMAAVQIGAALAPALQTAADWMRQFIRPVIDWIKANRALIATAFNIAVGVTAAGAAFVGVGTALGGFATAVSTVASLLGVLLSPIGLAVAAIGGIAHYTGIGGTALGWLGDMFTWLFDVASETWSGIADALATGDLGLAAEVAWSAVLMVWHTATQGIRKMWAEAVYWVQSTWDEIQYTLLDTFDALGFTWNDTVGDMGVTWAGYCAQTKIMWQSVVEYLGQTWDWLQTKATEAFATAFAYAQGLDAAATREAARETIAAYQRGEGKPPSPVPREQRERRERARDDRLATVDTDLSEARKRWRDVLAEAREARERVERGRPAEITRPDRPAFEDFAGADKKTGMTVGTFSKWALGGLGMGGGPAERTAKATEQTSQKMDKVIRQLQQQGAAVQLAVFGK